MIKLIVCFFKLIYMEFYDLHGKSKLIKHQSLSKEGGLERKQGKKQEGKKGSPVLETSSCVWWLIANLPDCVLSEDL